MENAKTVEEIKKRLHLKINEMVQWIYDDDIQGEPVDVCADFAEHLLPHIDESIDSAHALGMKK